MKPTALLIDTSRRPYVEEAALVRALSEDRFSGAHLAFRSKPPHAVDPLLRIDDVVLTVSPGPTWDNHVAPASATRSTMCSGWRAVKPRCGWCRSSRICWRPGRAGSVRAATRPCAPTTIRETASARARSRVGTPALPPLPARMPMMSFDRLHVAKSPSLRTRPADRRLLGKLVEIEVLLGIRCRSSPNQLRRLRSAHAACGHLPPTLGRHRKTLTAPGAAALRHRRLARPAALQRSMISGRYVRPRHLSFFNPELELEPPICHD